MTTWMEERNDSAGRPAAGDQDLDALAPGEARRLIRALRARQAELEARNDELEAQNDDLRARQRRLELIIDTVPAYIAYLDADLSILHINSAQAEWWGCARDQAVGKNYREVARPDAYAQNVPYLRQAVASARRVTHEFQATSATGQIAIGQVNSVPHLDEQGNVQGLLALSLDVTAQRRAEQALMAEQQKLDLILDSLPGYVVYFDADFRVLHVNRALAGWLGYDKDSIVGRDYQEIARPGSYELNIPHFRQAVDSRQSVTHELRSVSVTGQSAVVQAISVPQVDGQGNVHGLVVHMLDITEQRRAEEALRASEERYRLLVENMREGLAVLDDQARLTYVNDSLCAMTGWARGELLGQPSAVLFAAEDREQHLARLKRRQAGFSDTYEAVFRRQDGGTVPVLISASPILDPRGGYRGSLAVCTDVTEWVQVQETLRRRVDELTGLNRIAHTMAVAADLPATLAQACEITAALFAAHCVHVVWREGEEAGFHLHAGSEPAPAPGGPTRFDVSLDELSVLGQVLRAGKSQVIADVRSLSLSDLERELLVHRQVQSIMFVPLTIGGTAVGLLWVALDRPARAFTANEVRLAETIALDLAAAIESDRSARQSRAAAAAEERSRLARDLHDAATQTIYAATLIAESLPQLWANNPAEGQRNLVKLRQLVRGALAEMRTLIFELRPWTLEAVDLGRLLEHLGNALTGRTRVPVEWDIRGEHELPAATNVALYRIAQEAFNNVAKHARATRVRVTLRQEAELGILSIVDDGRGFDPGSVGAEKMGLQIMRERADAIGARLTVDSAPGRGTAVTVEWPGEASDQA